MERPKEMQELDARISRDVERLRKKLDAAMADRNDCIYRRRDMAAAARAQARADALESQIKELEEGRPRSLSELVPKKELDRCGVVEKIVAVHLAADFLNDAASVLRETLGKLGLRGCSLFPAVAQIEKLTNEFVGSVCGPEYAGLGEFLNSEDNFKLIKDLTALVQAHISERLDFKERKNRKRTKRNHKILTR